MTIWDVLLIVVAVFGVIVGRRLFTKGGKYYTPGRAAAFWIAWGIVVIFAGTLVVVGMVNL